MNKSLIISLPAHAPIVAQFYVTPYSWTLRAADTLQAQPVFDGASLLSTLTSHAAGKPIPGRTPLDPYSIRKEFLDLTSTEELRAFLDKTGRFAGSLTCFADLGEWQELILALMKTNPLDWHKLGKRHIAEKLKAVPDTVVTANFKWDRKSSFLELRAYSTFDAMVMATQIDHLRGAKFKRCRNPECRQVFEVLSRHGQIYCPGSCAHLMAMRAYRARKSPKLRARMRRA